MSKPLLICYIGFPGSGKTFFSTHLAEHLPAMILNSDAMRLAMFGSNKKIEELRKSDNSRLYTDVFGAMEYAARQTLRSRRSVIYDAQMAKREDRRRLEYLASRSNAIPVLVWIKTSKEVALRRGQERKSKEDSIPYTEEKMHYLIDRFESNTDLPEDNENLITIDGETSFERQYESFNMQLENKNYIN